MPSTQNLETEDGWKSRLEALRKERDEARLDAVMIFRCWKDDMPLPSDTRWRLGDYVKQFPEEKVD